MFRVFGVFALLAFSLVPAVLADPVPTTPAPGDKFTQGDKCTFSWVPDTTGKWKVMNVELMTGDNFNMIHLTSAFPACYLVYLNISNSRLREQRLLPLTGPTSP